MGVILFRDQGHWVTPDADFQTRNQITKISTGHFKKPGRECRLWHASRFASFSRLTRCQDSSQDAHIKMISTISKIHPGWVHQGHRPTPVVKNFYFLKNILNQHRNYVVKYFYPKHSRSLICIKIPYSKIPNNAPSLPAKILTFLCFEVERI